MSTILYTPGAVAHGGRGATGVTVIWYPGVSNHWVSVFVATIRAVCLSLRFGHHICGYKIRTTHLWLDSASAVHKNMLEVTFALTLRHRTVSRYSCMIYHQVGCS